MRQYQSPGKPHILLRGQGLHKVSKVKYLGVTISSNLEWNTHINSSVKKANKTLDFLKRNLKGASEEVRETTYKTMVHPQIEYCCAIWDPYMKALTTKVEMVLRRAARFILRRYHNTSSVSDMMNQLGWETFQIRKAKTRLVIMY